PGERSLLESPFAEMRLHLAADGLPFLLGHARGDAAIGDDLHAPVGEQQVDEDARVLLGVPHSLLGEHLARALARAEVAPELGRRELGLDHEADLAAVALLLESDLALDRIERRRRKAATRVERAHPDV